jgi:hypothetical protein
MATGLVYLSKGESYFPFDRVYKCDQSVPVAERSKIAELHAQLVDEA